jgi:hypothetical protein
VVAYPAGGDNASIHQAPATLVGLLKSKVSTESEAYGIQLPPCGSVRFDLRFREELARGELVKLLRKRALGARSIFIGIGTTASGGDSPQSFLKLANEVTRGSFSASVERLG